MIIRFTAFSEKTPFDKEAEFIFFDKHEHVTYSGGMQFSEIIFW